MSTSGGAGGGGGGAVLRASVAIAGSAIDALNTSAVTIVPTPGPMKFNVVVQAEAYFSPGVMGFNGLFDPVICYGMYATALSTHIILGNPLIPTTGPPQYRFGFEPGDQEQAQGPGSMLLTSANDQPLVVTNIFDVDRAGPIVTATIANAGSGYAVGDTGVVDVDVYDGGAGYVVDTVAPVTGAILTFHITFPGDGYSTTDNPLTTTKQGAQPGVGVNFQVNVTAIPPSDGTLHVTVLYHTVDIV